MTPTRPTVVSLFTGAGGLDIGLERAGFQTVSAVDNEPDCVQTLLVNQQLGHANGSDRLLAGTKIHCGNVADIDAAALRPAGAGAEWAPEVLAGGPPCQPFSSAGRMGSVADPRGRLFEHFVRLAEELRPRMILFENVRGLVTARGSGGEPGEVLTSVKAEFERIGYATTFALLNAADYGAPQRRVRCFMMATRRTELPVFPEPTHAERPAYGLFAAVRPWLTLGDFLAAGPVVPDVEVVRPSPRLEPLLRDLPEGTGLKSAGAREATRPGGHWGYRQGTFIASLSQPARTVTGSSSQDWVRLVDGSLRRLTLSECAGLQGFPAGWRFCGPAASRFKQVGNAVPTVFGEVLGRAMAEALRRVRRSAPESAPLPKEFRAAMEYTRREHARNGASRVEVRARLAAAGAELDAVKGFGSAGRPAAAKPRGG